MSDTTGCAMCGAAGSLLQCARCLARVLLLARVPKAFFFNDLGIMSSSTIQYNSGPRMEVGSAERGNKC